MPELPKVRASREFLAWCAGFFDGEGSISTAKDRATGKISLRVHVTQVDPTPLLRLQGRFEGHISIHRRANGSHQQTWAWSASNGRAIRFLELVLPFLVVKSKLAELAVSFPVSQMGVKLSGGENQKRVHLRESIHEANGARSAVWKGA